MVPNAAQAKIAGRTPDKAQAAEKYQASVFSIPSLPKAMYHRGTSASSTKLKTLVKTVSRNHEVFFAASQAGKPAITEFPAGSPGLEPREECGLSKFFNLGPNAAKPCT